MQVARATRARATVANFDKYSTSTFADTGDAVYEMPKLHTRSKTCATLLK